jgi:S-formylglutathione hydrolase FrmB
MSIYLLNKSNLLGFTTAVLLAAVVNTQVSAAGATPLPIEKEGLTLNSKCLNKELKYSIILPADASAEKRYPVIYLLHGIGGDNSSWLEYSNPARLLQRMVEAGEMEPMIMVMPDGYLSYYSDAADGSLPYETAFTTELMATIDSLYPTIPDREHRAIAGFSMGGFGAMTLGLRNRDKFTAIAAFSPSIRTDEQYASEGPQEEWEKQWGRTFGGVGLTGTDRITPYYKTRSPYHILDTIPVSEIADMTLIIDIGDEEGTLTASNEQLHRRLLQRGINHSWTVRGGGHDFKCWNEALPDVLRRISREFNDNGSTINNERTDNASVAGTASSADALQLGKVISINSSQLYFPDANAESSRRYPVVYINGNFSTAEQQQLVKRANLMVNDGTLSPMIFCFLAERDSITDIEQQVAEIRDSRRMRADIEIQQPIAHFNRLIATEPMFTATILDRPIQGSETTSHTIELLKSHSRYPRLWISQTPNDSNYALASDLHILMRSAKLKHKFRVDAASTSDALLPHWEEWLKFIDARFHV